MPRNKSEKLPNEDPEVDPDFYKLLHIYAEAHVEDGTPSQRVRDNAVRWGGRDPQKVYELFRPWTQSKKDLWYRWSEDPKRAYVADYMDYLYGTQ